MINPIPSKDSTIEPFPKSLKAAGKELAFQNKEIKKRAAELIIANKELVFQNKEKGKRAEEFIITNKELKNTEEELEVTHQRLLFHVDNTPLGYIEWDREGHIKCKSAKAEEIFGWTMKELLAGEKTAYDQVYEEDLPLVTKIVKQLINGEVESNKVQNRNITKDGRVIWCEWFNSVLKDKNGKVLTIMSLVQDITVQKKLEEDLTQSENRFRVLIEKSTEMKTLSNIDGEPIYVSPSITKLLGYSLKEIFDKLAFDIIHPDDIPEFAEKRKTILQTPGKSFHIWLRFLHKNGNWIWCEGTVTNMLHEPGINALVSNFRDISERKEAELAQIESNNLIQTIYNASLDAVIIIDEEGIITKWDAKSEILFGWKEKEVAGMKLSEIIIPESYREMHNKGIKHYLKTGQGPVLGKTIDVSALKKNGVEFDVSLSITPSQINRKTHFIGFIRDISEKKKTDKQREFDKNNLNALINNTSDLMWSVDRDFNLITSNLPFDEMGKVNFGKTISKGGNVLSTANSPEMRSHFKELYERAFAGEAFTEISHFEYPVEFWTEISYYPIRNGNEIIGVACHSRDITELRRGAENLKQSKARLKEAQALSHISNWQVDLLTGIHTWSEEFYHILGITRGDVQPSAEVFLSHIHPDDFKYAKEEVEKTFETFAGSSLHVRIITEDGTPQYVYSEWQFEFDKNNKPIRLYGILQDVTERKSAEEAIRQSEARFRGFFDNAPEVIVVLDLESLKFTKTNLNASKLFKFSSEEFAGKGPADISPEFQPDGRKSAEKATEYIKQAIGGERVVFEWVHCDADKREIMCEVHLAILPDASRPQIYASIINITERKRAEESNKFKAELLNTIGQAVIATDLSGIINFWNRAAEKIYGWTAEETLGKNVIDIIPAAQTKEQAIELMGQLAQGNSWSGEFFVQHKNGHSFPVFVTDAPTYDQFHKLSGIIGVSSDISERIKTEQILLKSEDQYRKAQTMAKMGHWELSIKDNFLMWSDEIYRIFDIDKQSLTPLHQQFLHSIHPGDIEAFNKAQKEVYAGKKVLDIVHRIITGDGTVRIVHEKGELIKDEISDSLLLTGTVQDITDIKNAEQKIIESELKYRSLIEQASDTIVVVNTEGSILEINSSSEKLFGYTRDELLKMKLKELLFSEDPAPQMDGIAEGKVVVYERRIKRKDETPVDVEVSARVISDGRILGIFRDISERKKGEKLSKELNKNLQKQAIELTRSNEELEQFAYVASHDLQEPLRMVTSFLTQLEKKYGDVIDDKGKKYIEFAVDGAKRMRQIILDLLEFSRVGRIEDKIEIVDLNQVVEEIQILFRKQIEEKSAVLHFDKLPVVNSYNAPLRQVFQNLIGNALKYTHKDLPAKIDITVEESDSHWQFTVTDNGIGIAKEYYDKIFLIFQRLHNKDEFSGTGMGLAVTKKIIENLGGKIWIESEEGRGSAFYFTLPKK